MSTCTAENLPKARRHPPAVLVTGPDSASRVRIVRTLAGLPELSVRQLASASTLLAGGAVCDLLVLHCRGVKAGEVTLFRQLRERHDGLRIVAICESPNGKSTRLAVDGVVDGLVYIDDVDTALVPTVAAVLAGQTAVPRHLRAGARGTALSYREKQVLRLVVMGYTNGEIGTRLYLAESTVKSHLSSAFGKLGVRSRSEAAAMILDPQGPLRTSILSTTGLDEVTPNLAAVEIAQTRA